MKKIIDIYYEILSIICRIILKTIGYILIYIFRIDLRRETKWLSKIFHGE